MRDAQQVAAFLERSGVDPERMPVILVSVTDVRKRWSELQRLLPSSDVARVVQKNPSLLVADYAALEIRLAQLKELFTWLDDEVQWTLVG
jgi:hypothetical protein